jgi:ferritin-like metal-binding protein YciE
MFNSIDDKSDKKRFTEYINEILSAENAIVERLHNRIQETQFPEFKNTLQHELQEEKNHQSRLKNLISQYGGKPTDSKAKLLSLNSATAQTIDITDNSSENDKKIKSSLHGDDNDNMNNDDVATPLESEILRIKEDAMIKNAEILGYKMVLKIAEKINANDAINTLKKNLQEKELTYNKLIDSASETLNQIDDDDDNSKKNHRAHKQNVSFQLGSAIADILTSSWNSKENPSKVYIFNRRVHHGAIGALLGLSNLYKKQPMITGILSGLGAGLAKDDYNDFREWFLFKRKEDEDVK